MGLKFEDLENKNSSLYFRKRLFLNAKQPILVFLQQKKIPTVLEL